MNSILNVYNNYHLLNYPKKRVGQHSAHNRKELKDIYDSIIKMTRESPLYKFDSSVSTYQYTIDIKEEANSLKESLVALNEQMNPDAIVSRNTVVSSQSDTASVNNMGDKKKLADFEGFELEVDQLASPQINTGAYLPENRLRLAPDNYSFDIEINNLRYEFQYQVSNNDTNLSIQERLARLINKSNIGIHAEVLKDNTKGSSALQLESKATGAPENISNYTIFEISNNFAENSDNSVQYFDLQRIHQYPQNAFCSIDGEKITSASNTFIVNQAFEINLKQVSPETEPVQIGFKTDLDSMSDTIKELTTEYNSILDLADSYSADQNRSSILYRDISSIARYNKSSLESIGLAVGEDGSIHVDDSLLSQSLSENTQDTLLSLDNFQSLLLYRSNHIMLNPMDYVNKTIVSYPNPHRTFANPYVTSAYSGMLFNGYC